MDRKKKGIKLPDFSEFKIVLTVLALILLAGGAYLIWGRLASGEPRVTIVKGDYAPGFPKQYILEDGVVPTESAFTTYPGETKKFWSASYVSALSPREIISKYHNILGFLGANITQETSSFIYAKSLDFDFSAKAQPFGTSTKVAVSFLSKK